MNILSRIGQTIAIMLLCGASPGSYVQATEIHLHNAMASPVTVRLTSAATGRVTDVLIGRNQTRPFDFFSPEFIVQIFPVDDPGTSFGVGRVSFQRHVGRFRDVPLILRGDFQDELCLDGVIRRVRVAVHVDIAHERRTALAPGYELVAAQPLSYLVPVVLR